MNDDARHGAGASTLPALPWLALGVLCLWAFYDVAPLYGGFDIRQGVGVQNIHKNEVQFSLWYMLFGTLALGCFGRAIAYTSWPQTTLASLSHALEAPQKLARNCAILALSGSFVFRRLALLDQPITDDELTYDFIARTLLEGRLTNALPIDAAFLKNQFVVVSEHAWYGKYPIGHPIVLALGKLLHLQVLVVPAIGALGVLLTFHIGRRMIGDRWAALACVLMLASPHYIWTHATQLSQPTSMLCMLLGMLACLRLQETRELRFAALAGAAFGFGIVVRPLPSALFALAALLAYVVASARGSFRERLGEHAKALLLAGALIAAGLATVMLVNRAQSGSVWTSGYHVIHGGTDLLDTGRGLLSASLGGALLRENLWLHGWPLSLAFVPLARFRRGSWLLWGMIAATLAYRLLVPKTVVATTGPIYTMEIVPLLCLATAAGIARGTDLLGRALAAPERARQLVTAWVLAAMIVSAVLFIPIQLASAYRGASARAKAFEALSLANAEDAVVFSNVLVSSGSALSWALFPPSPSPSLDDEQLFLRLQRGPEGYARMLKLWKTRFPKRRAVLLFLTPTGFVVRDLGSFDKQLPTDFAWDDPR